MRRWDWTGSSVPVVKVSRTAFRPVDALEFQANDQLESRSHKQKAIAPQTGSVPNMTRRIGLLVLLHGAVGCTRPAVVVEPPSDAPTELCGRRLWHTQSAYIYASHRAAADETDEWIRELSAHLGRTYDGPPLAKGLVVVADAGDAAPVVSSLEALDRLEQRLPPMDARPRVTVDERRQRLAEQGLAEPLAMMIAIAPLEAIIVTAMPAGSAPFAAATSQPRPDGASIRLPADVGWMICCPTRRLAVDVTRSFAPTAVERKLGKPFAIMAAPLIPVAALEAAKAFDLARDVLVFRLWAEGKADWDDRRRLEEAQRYQGERALRLSPLLPIALQKAHEQG